MEGRKNNGQNRKDKYNKQDQKRKGSKGRKFSDRCDDRDLNTRNGSDNDVHWYLANPALIRDTANYPYAWPLGNKVDLHYKLNPTAYSGNRDADKWRVNKNALPGVMTLKWEPTIGFSDGPDAPVNLAARSIYTYVRHVNSGATNYQSTDLMLYLLAMDSVYSWWSALRRLYGTMMTYSYLNRYYPRALVTAMGFNYDDIKDNMAQLRAHINQLAVRMGSFAVPASMSYMARHQWMNENMYLDSPTGKGQTYLFRQRAYWVFQYNNTTKVGELKRTYAKDNMTFREIVEFTNSLLDPIVWDEDFNIMSGDILKAFGNDGILKTFDTKPDYILLPVYNAEVLSQMMNSTGYGTFRYGNSDENVTVWQKVDDLTSDSYLMSKPNIMVGYATAIGQGAGQEDRFITFNFDNVTPENTIVATRLTNIITKEPGSAVQELRTCGSEVVTGYSIYTLGKGTQENSILVTNFTSILEDTYIYNKVDDNIPNFADLFNTLAQIGRFDWHPAVNISIRYRNGADGNSDTFVMYDSLFDVNNYTILSARDLEQMASVIMQNMFAVPLMGAWQGHI